MAKAEILKIPYTTDEERDQALLELGPNAIVAHHINVDKTMELHVYPGKRKISIDERITALEERILALEGS